MPKFTADLVAAIPAEHMVFRSFNLSATLSRNNSDDDSPTCRQNDDSYGSAVFYNGGSTIDDNKKVSCLPQASPIATMIIER